MDIIERLLDWNEHDEGKINDARQEGADEIERLRKALRMIDASTISHVDGRDLLDELHPRNTLDIKRRIDGKETLFEGDWLSSLRDARNAARKALGEKE